MLRRIAVVLCVCALGAAALAQDYKPAARIDLYGQAEQGTLELVEKSDNISASRCKWLPKEEDVNRSWYMNISKIDDQWQEISFTLKPTADMSVRVSVRGAYYKTEDGKHPHVPTWYDGIEVEGAELINGDFEDDAKTDAGVTGWTTRPNEGESAQILTDASKAKSGSKFLQATCYRQANQVIDLKAGQPVKFTLWARATE